MKEKTRRRIESMVIAESEAHGDEWVHPDQVGARVHTEAGSDVWRSSAEDDDRAIQRVFDKLMGEYIDKHGSLQNGGLPAKVEKAIDRFESTPSLDTLVALAEILERHKA